MSEQVNRTQVPKHINYINLNPDTQSKIVDQVIANTSGVALGMLLTVLGLLLLAKWMGINNLIIKWVEKLESDTESFRTLANSVQDMSSDSKTNHNTYVADHNKIIDEVREVRVITKEILYKIDKV